jgi:hypothetical protein
MGFQTGVKALEAADVEVDRSEGLRFKTVNALV